jgi:hypothetical protein
MRSPPASVRESLEVKGEIKQQALIAAVKQMWGVEKRTCFYAIAPEPVAAPALTKERFIAIVAGNLAIAERSGNEAAAKLLRRIARDAVSLFEHISLQSE